MNLQTNLPMSDSPSFTPYLSDQAQNDIQTMIEGLFEKLSGDKFDPGEPMSLITANFKTQIRYIPDFRLFLSHGKIVYLMHLIWYFAKNGSKDTLYAKMNCAKTAQTLHISVKTESRMRSFFKSQGLLDAHYCRKGGYVLVHIKLDAIKAFVDKVLARVEELKRERNGDCVDDDVAPSVCDVAQGSTFLAGRELEDNKGGTALARSMNRGKLSNVFISVDLTGFNCREVTIPTKTQMPVRSPPVQ
jgi:DNA-binding IscR family transcriptional regulator